VVKWLEEMKMFNRKSLIMAGVAAISLSGVAFDSGVEAKNKASDISAPQAITPSEKAQGAKAHPDILAEFGGAYQSPQTAYVVGVGKNISLQSGLGNAQSDFTVTLLNSSVNNAFAIPGGYVYITRQLVALCNSEAEMAGVLGHEVGHVAARHSKKRQRQSTIANILGAGGAILGGLLGDNGGLIGALGGAAQKYSGTVAQLLTLSYSRSQEEQADDLGIQYLSKAGYDPSALADMLNSLALQTSVDARVAGQSGGGVPEWASTHPEPAKRVFRAAANAKAYPASSNRKQDTHFAAINGMLYGDDPKQGVVEGQQFLHPDLRIKFSAPDGFGIANGTSEVSINGTGGKALFSTAAYSGDKQAYIDAIFKAVSGQNSQVDYGPINQTTVNGVPAFYATALVASQQGGQNEVTVYAYELSRSQAFHFVTIAPANSNPFGSMYQSFARMSANEAAAVKPRKVKIVTVGKNDTMSSLAAKMAYKSMQLDRFLALNGLRSDASLSAGKKVKIVTY
jgi:predicted Zn-dependent protease